LIESFNLDTYLTKEYIFRTIDEEMVNDLPELDFILKKIKLFLEKHKFSKDITGQGQRYYAKFTFDKNNYCIINWDIERAKIICENKKISIVTLNVDELVERIAKDAINPRFLKKGLYNNEPIIIAHLPILSSFTIIIDGNHRVMGRYKNDIKDIKAYLLESKYHYFAMGNDTSRAIFISLMIIDNIKKYLTNKITKSYLISSIKKIDSFYNISVKKEMLKM